MADSIYKSAAQELKQAEPNLPKDFYNEKVVAFLMNQPPEETSLVVKAKDFHQKFIKQSERLGREHPGIYTNNLILLAVMMEMDKFKENEKLYHAKIDLTLLNLFEAQDNYPSYLKQLKKLPIDNESALTIAKNQCFVIPQTGYVKASKDISQIDIGESAQMLCAVSPFHMFASGKLDKYHGKTYTGKRSVPVDILISVLKLPSNAGLDLTHLAGSTTNNYVSYVNSLVQKKNQATSIYGAIFQHRPTYKSPANLVPFILNTIVWGTTLLVEIPCKTLAALMTNLLRATSQTKSNASFGRKLLAGVLTLALGAILYIPSQILFAVGNLASYTRSFFDGLSNLVSLGFAKLGEMVFKTSHVDKYPSIEFSIKTMLGNALNFLTGGLPFLAGPLTIISNRMDFNNQSALKKSVGKDIEESMKVIKEESVVIQPKEEKTSDKTSEKVEEISPEPTLGSSAKMMKDVSAPAAEIAKDATQEWIDSSERSLQEIKNQFDKPSILSIYQEMGFLPLKIDTGQIILSQLDEADPKKKRVADTIQNLEKMESQISEKLQPTKQQDLEKTVTVEVEMQTTPTAKRI